MNRPEGVWRLPGLRLRSVTTARRGDRGRWAAAATLDDLCRLTVGWLTGDLVWQPGYYGPVDVDEDQAPGLTAALISLNAAGVCTRNSQAGYVGTGADGAVWVQHAAVTGYADTQAWYQLLQAMDGTRYQVLAHTVRPRLHRARPGVVITRRDGRPHTGFGAQLGAGQVRADLDGAGRPAVTEAVRALQVTVWDPTPGANTLWEHLVGAPGSPPTSMPRPDPITDPADRPVCNGGESTQTGRDQVVCSGCAEPGQVVVVTQSSRAGVWSRLVTGGPWRAWCAPCWPHRCPGTSRDTSVWWLDAPYTGGWAALDRLLGDRFPDDCSSCGGWNGPLTVVSWTDQSQTPGEAWAFCRPCAVRQVEAGTWGPQETLAELGARGRTIAEQVAAVQAAHARRVPAAALTIDDLAPVSAAASEAMTRTALRLARALWVGVDADTLCGHLSTVAFVDRLTDQLPDWAFWLDQLQDRDNAVVVDGRHYRIAPDLPDGQTGAGFDGHEFEIRYLADGREVVTRNLWTQGLVPEAFRALLPDTAVFASTADRRPARPSGGSSTTCPSVQGASAVTW